MSDSGANPPPDTPSTAEHPVMEQLERAGREARWHMSRRTLELAISALETDTPTTRTGGRGKSRRRKRSKRLL